jgi:glycosyltransferase involved in cell wall biosynthesis
MRLTFAFCTYNRAGRLEKLVAAMRAENCSLPFEILVVNNNSRDNTPAILEWLANQPGAPLRFVTETAQGIVPARNRVISEALDSDILVFIDDDELPCPGMLSAVCDAILNEGAECVGGRISVDFESYGRPAWLDKELLGFLAEVDYGDRAIWISNDATPLWTGNIAYDMKLFRADPDLRFDQRFNREGNNVGGGEDVMMFRTLLARQAKLRYRPDMAITHSVEPSRLQRKYFLKLHYSNGLRNGHHQLSEYPRSVLGVPPFLVSQLFMHGLKYLTMLATLRPGTLRQAMNAIYTWGMIVGQHRRWKHARRMPST